MRESMVDLLIVGGGVVGLSLAYEAAAAGMSVRVIDRGQPGREASWAGAGILPPAGDKPSGDPRWQLLRLSNALHAQWARQLREETGVDNGFRRCGGIYLARTDDGELRQTAHAWRQAGLAAELLKPAELADIEPGLDPSSISCSVWLPDEAQLRNPRHLKALIAACALRGVEFRPGVAAEGFQVVSGRIAAVDTQSGRLVAGAVCISGGPWSRTLLARLGIELAIVPVRGQIVLLDAPRSVLRRIVNEGARYLVPRGDGRVLVGSTEENAGFDKRTTAEGVAGLLDFAVGLAPGLKAAQVERCWAGLRPATPDGLPYLGRVPGLDNAYVAAGHFRSGLQLSPGTAAAMCCLIQGLEAPVDLAPFRLDR